MDGAVSVFNTPFKSIILSLHDLSLSYNLHLLLLFIGLNVCYVFYSLLANKILYHDGDDNGVVVVSKVVIITYAIFKERHLGKFQSVFLRKNNYPFPPFVST